MANAIPAGRPAPPNPYAEPERDPNRVFKTPPPPAPLKPVRPRMGDKPANPVCIVKLPPRPCEVCKSTSQEKAAEMFRMWGGWEVNRDSVERWNCEACGKPIEVRTPEAP